MLAVKNTRKLEGKQTKEWQLKGHTDRNVMQNEEGMAENTGQKEINESQQLIQG